MLESVRRGRWYQVGDESILNIRARVPGTPGSTVREGQRETCVRRSLGKATWVKFESTQAATRARAAARAHHLIINY